MPVTLYCLNLKWCPPFLLATDCLERFYGHSAAGYYHSRSLFWAWECCVDKCQSQVIANSQVNSFLAINLSTQLYMVYAGCWHHSIPLCSTLTCTVSPLWCDHSVLALSLVQWATCDVTTLSHPHKPGSQHTVSETLTTQPAQNTFSHWCH